MKSIFHFSISLALNHQGNDNFVEANSIAVSNLFTSEDRFTNVSLYSALLIHNISDNDNCSTPGSMAM